MTDDEKKTCLNCKFFQLDTDRSRTGKNGNMIEDKDGYCRVNPPIIVGDRSLDGIGRHHGSWPIVGRDDWCGQWSAR